MLVPGVFLVLGRISDVVVVQLIDFTNTIAIPVVVDVLEAVPCDRRVRRRFWFARPLGSDKDRVFFYRNPDHIRVQVVVDLAGGGNED